MSPLDEVDTTFAEDLHLEALKQNSKQLTVMYINTQSMISTFDNLLLAVDRYKFDVITMSENRLKENHLLLQYVTIPGYTHAFNNRDKKRSSGVEVYIKDSIKFKRRSDIEKKYPTLEHLWLEIPGCNKHSRLLLGTIYRFESMVPYSDWIVTFESPRDFAIHWDGALLLTGDLNVDLQRPDIPATKKYSDVLKTMSLQQLVSKPTRTTQHSSTLIGHIITNIPNQVTQTDVISSLMISDHDAPYVCINVRITRFVPRYKFIRNEKNFNADAFIEDFEQLPLSIVYSTDDPNMQVDL